MSIYDDQFNQDADKPPVPPASASPAPDQLASPPPKPDGDQHVPEAEEAEPEPRRRRGCGCGSCLLVFLGLGLLSVLCCGIAGYLGVQRAPDWAHDAIVAAVNDSDLDPEAKQEITAQMDRLLKEYKAGNVSGEQIGEALEEFAESPIMLLIMAYAAMESYVEPSGLSDDEKNEAKLAFQRVARGTFEKKVDPDDLERALDYISKKDFNGNRQIKNKISDEELRSLVKECTRVADEAEIPNEPYQVDVAAEVKRIVDRALGIAPEPMEADDADGHQTKAEQEPKAESDDSQSPAADESPGEAQTIDN